jgi:hypothetical protein
MQIPFPQLAVGSGVNRGYNTRVDLSTGPGIAVY